MLKEKARVVSTSHGLAKVAIVRSEACGNCPSKSMCHTSSGRLNVLEVRNSVEARPGEEVVIELPPDDLVKATTMLYLLPAAAMVTGATVGWLKAGTDLGAMAGTIAGFAIASLFLFIHGRNVNSTNGPRISRVLSHSGISHTVQSH